MDYIFRRHSLSLLAASVVFFSLIFRWMDTPMGWSSGEESRFYSIWIAFSFMYILYYFSKYNYNILSSFSSTDLFLLLWLLWCWVGADYSINIYDKHFWSYFRNAAMSVSTFVIISACVRNESTLRDTSYAMLIASLFLFFISFESGMSIVIKSLNYRLGTAIGNSNDFAYHLMFGLIGGFLLLAITGNRTLRIIIYISMFAIIYGITSSGSRKVFLGLMLLSVYATYQILVDKRLLIKYVFIMTIFLFMFSSLFLFSLENTYVGERLMSIRSLSELENYEVQRLDAYYNLPDLLKDNIFTGVGLGSHIKYSRFNKDTHSDFVTAFGETGLIGGILYYYVYIYLLVCFYKIRQLRLYIVPSTLKIVRIMGFSTLVLLLMGLGRWNYSTPIHFAYLAIITGYLRGIVSSSQHNKSISLTDAHE